MYTRVYVDSDYIRKRKQTVFRVSISNDVAKRLILKRKTYLNVVENPQKQNSCHLETKDGAFISKIPWRIRKDIYKQLKNNNISTTSIEVVTDNNRVTYLLIRIMFKTNKGLGYTTRKYGTRFDEILLNLFISEMSEGRYF